ncbi:MAG: hypothetical protein LBG99_04430 [Propionibacteriaceae bacterium]|nr:hypothetical protein [Propionibacteriaceae bacterium]
MTELYDDELLKEVDDDIVRPRNAPSRPGSGWGKPSIVVAILVGVIFGAMMGAWLRPGQSPGPSHPTMGATIDGDSVVRMSELEAHVEENPEDVEARLELGELYWGIGNLGMAKEQIDEVINLDPDSADAWFMLGMYYWFIEPPDCDKVEESWIRYMKLDPEGDHAKVLAHMDECKLIQESSDSETGR